MANKGVVVGLRQFTVAVLIDDPAGGQATYETPVGIAGAISARVSPTTNSETLFADDSPYEVATSMGEITVEVNVADLSLEHQALLFGHTLTAGVLRKKGSDTPPWVAVGYKTLKSNGKYRYTWLLKGRFQLPEQNNQTKGDTIAFNTPTATGNFVTRESDDMWQIDIDEDNTDFVPTMADTWFTDPFGTGSGSGGGIVIAGGSGLNPPAPLEVTTVTPADKDTNVELDATVAIEFNRPVALSSINSGTVMVFDDASGSAVAGTLKLNGTRTIVTFVPASLSASTDYRVLVTTGVTDVFGDPVVASKVTTFTTKA